MVPACAVCEEEKRLVRLLANSVKKLSCKYSKYSLRPILLFTNIDVSRHILVIDTSVLAKSIMGRRE
jgi:hypothetical protein